MKFLLTEKERQHLDELVAAAEKKTGAQIVLAYVKRSDVYAELPWKAFALGAAITGVVIAALDLLRPSWTGAHTVLAVATAVLAAGAAFALLCMVVPVFARVFLDANRAETEVRQYAESLFLSRELFATSRRTGILLFVSLFERKVVVLPDKGLAGRLTDDERKKLISRLAGPLAAGRISRAFAEGIDELEEALGAGAAGAAGKNELTNAVIDGEGA